MLRDKILESIKVNKEDYLFNVRVPHPSGTGMQHFDVISKKDYEAISNRHYTQNEIIDNRLEEVLKKAGHTPQTKQTIETPQLVENIEQYYKDYIEHREAFNKISPSTIKANNASFRYFKYFINEDTELNFKFFKDLQKQFTQLPKNFFKYPKYYSKTFEELLKLKKREKYEVLDTKTINAHINNFRVFFDYLLYEEIIDNNPMNNLKTLLEDRGTNKEEYTPEELEKIFTSDMDKDYKNMCKVSLYCGLRIEEVLSLKKENIKDNIIYIDLADKSTKKHQRMIPIHKNLLDTINYQIKRNRGKYLFFAGNVGNEVTNVGKRVNRRLKNIVDIKEKTFHSFRKNFSQNIELNSNSEDKIKKYLMGHSQSKDITHMIYNRGKVNLDKLKECIDSLDFTY